ncbi:hypothetical protein [Dulcicalothrix desertica]|uniref:hypothetical protein n=1 Tax=Dulcicalothrix desertica TaxID=32056 RepID=UPI00119AA2A0|nr:hypothetical protein [Dulcicalothrix desertica]TWH40954.1 hypothetical protein CAL7102_10318 [Dulcicalothrix desertica PCC 7102]
MNTTSTKDFNRNSVSVKARLFPAKEPGGRYWTGNKIRKSSNTNISSRKNDDAKFLEDKQDLDISSRKIDGAKFLEDKQDLDISSRKIDGAEFLEDIQDLDISSRKIDGAEFLEDKQDSNISSRKIDGAEFLEDKQDSNISSRKKRRLKGDGSGCIYYRTSIKNGKEYHEAYFQYEFWKKGDCLSKSSRYIPKKLLKVVQELNQCKAPVREILAVLGEIL